MRLPPPLVALTPGSLRPGQERGLLAAVDAALGAGLRGVLVREPGLSDRALAALGAALRQRLAEGWLALHDRPHVALAVGADAVHLGFRSLPLAAVRAGFGDDLTIGLSTHAHDDPRAWAAASYVFHGPVRPTPSKQGLLEPVGMEGLARACRASPVPVLAIGGLEPEDAPAVLASGAHGLAVLRGVLAARDPARAAARFLAALADLPGASDGGRP